MATIDSFDIRRYTSRNWSDEIGLVESLYSSFERIGLAKLAASRIRTYRRIYTEFRDAAKAGRRLTQSEAEEIFGTLVEVHQLQRIVAAATASERAAVWVDHLRKLISGPPTLRPSGRHSASWDYQFEAFMAAVAVLSGYSVQFNEPDVVVDGPDGRFGIAAKRPRSMAKFGSRLSEGAHQVNQTALPGVIALDLSFALYPGQCINADSVEAAVAFLTAAAKRTLDQNIVRVKSIFERPGILGILVQIHLPILILTGERVPPLITCIRWTVAPSARDERAAWVTAFARRCEQGLLRANYRPKGRGRRVKQCPGNHRRPTKGVWLAVLRCDGSCMRTFRATSARSLRPSR